MIELKGERHELTKKDAAYPSAFERLGNAPETLYVIGNVEALVDGIAICGARRATESGMRHALHFATTSAENGFRVVTGGSRGIDTMAAEGALKGGVAPVVFLAGGLGKVYPPENIGLFQRAIDAGGAICSEQAWDVSPIPWMFRARNRLIASLSKGVLIVEAGLPSGTFSLADEALECDREVMVVPGDIDNRAYKGCNQLIWQGAIPVINDDVFKDLLSALRE